MRQNLKTIKEQQNKLSEQKNLTREIELIITNVENFSSQIGTNLDGLDWNGKRGIIRQVVKRIEVDDQEINIVYKINNLPDYENSKNVQHCFNRKLRS